MVSLFHETTEAHADITYVKVVWGLTSTQFVDGHNHELINLALHNCKGLQVEDLKVTLVRQSAKPLVMWAMGLVLFMLWKAKVFMAMDNVNSL